MRKKPIKYDSQMLTRKQIVKREREEIRKELKEKFTNGKYWKGKTIINFIDNYLKERKE